MSRPGRLNCAPSSFSASAMPTAFARPWPSGPVVVSIAERQVVLRVTGGLAAELAEVLDLLDATADSRSDAAPRTAASRRGRWTARSGRGRTSADCRVVLEESPPQHLGDVRHAHRRARVAGIGLLDGVHGQGADGVGKFARCAHAALSAARGRVEGVRRSYPGAPAGRAFSTTRARCSITARKTLQPRPERGQVAGLARPARLTSDLSVGVRR